MILVLWMLEAKWSSEVILGDSLCSLIFALRGVDLADTR